MNAILYVPKGTREVYLAADYWKDFKEIVEIPDEVTVEMGATMATLASTFALDFTEVEGLKAYTVSEFDAESMTVKAKPLEQAAGAMGLLLMAETAGTYQIPVIKSAEVIRENLLRGTLTDKEMRAQDGSYRNFILGNGSEGLGFYAVQDGTMLSGGKAYLPLPSAAFAGEESVKGLRIELEGGTTGLDVARKQEAAPASAAIYDLSGRRTEAGALKPGLYVRDGKKFIVR